LICIIQARYNSKRLIGKVLKKIQYKTILERVVNQLKKSKKIKKIIIATSTSLEDKKIVKLCKRRGYDFFCGPLNNVYKRFKLVIEKQNCKSFIRINADSPLIDYKIVNIAINYFKKKQYDIVTNTFPRSFPKGFSVEIINSKTFLNNFKNITNLKDKEHITRYFYINYKKFKIMNFSIKKDLSSVNLSVDNNLDFIRVKTIIKNIKNRNLFLNNIIKVYNKI
jgi:spore coat polysaccharide biosynthesis protein SpsF (cytidylyltransferase family)